MAEPLPHIRRTAYNVYKPSVFDRLLADEIAVEQGSDNARYQFLDDVIKSIRCDLEALLNTIRVFQHQQSPEFKYVNRSILYYGLPDLTSYNPLESVDQNEIGKILQETIECYEPRLDRVQVLTPSQQPNVQPSSKVTADSLNHDPEFVIVARLRLPPQPEVNIKATLELQTRQFKVRSSTDGS